MMKIKIVILLLVIFVSNSAIAQTKVFIPDANFRNALNTRYPNIMDISGDSLIIDSAATRTYLSCGHANISDLTGIEYFINLEVLYCINNQLTSLPDLSALTALTTIICQINQLTSLPDLSADTALTELDCSGNQLTSLPNLSANTALTKLNCGYNQLTSLPDLSADTALSQLYCSNNQLTSLPDLSANTSLTSLSCYNNQLTSLPNLSANTELHYLNCGKNQLTSLPDLSANTALTELLCDSNQLSSLDISGCTALEEINISYMPTLGEVCVWEVPFPPVGVTLDTTSSPNVYFTDCTVGSSNTCELNYKIDIYPNPNKGTFNIIIESIQPENLELRIFNSLGQQVFIEQIKHAKGTYTGQFNLREYTAGIYYLQIKGSNGVINKQIVIE